MGAETAAVERYRWTCVTAQAAFAPRDGAGLLAFADRLWLLGGWNPSDKVHFPRICNSEVWSTRDGADWTRVLEAAPWEGRHTAGYAVHDGRMWIVGGDANQGHYQNDVWCTDDGVKWTCVCEKVPWGPRVLHHTVAFDGRIWVIGGQTLPQFAPAPEQFHADVWCSTDGVKWEWVTLEAPWAPRGMIGGAAVLNGRIWLLGGGTYDTPSRPARNFYHDVWSTADGRDWRCATEAAAWPARQYHEVAAWDDRLWVLEGYHQEGGNRRDVWHSADGATWTELPGTPWRPRHAASVTVYDGALWVVAGNNMTPDAWRLDPATAA